MIDLTKLPIELQAAIITAILAAIGYLLKLICDAVGTARSVARARRARLVELFSHLQAAQVAYRIQCNHRNDLARLLDARETWPKGYDARFTAAYPTMTDEERELHTIIRAITTNTIRPLNRWILRWLREDDYFKAKRLGSVRQPTLAGKLGTLESHLLLWQAKYAAWMTDPAHALVYLVDEKKHGVGFPTGIEDDVNRLLRPWWDLTSSSQQLPDLDKKTSP